MLINQQIRDKEVRLIGADGTQLGVVSIQEAMRIAKEAGLDLAKVSSDNAPPPATCKLMDYGKYRYEQQKREKDQKKNQRVIQTKEVRLSAVIDIGDLSRLAKQTVKFLEDGDKVRASILLRRREQAHPEIAMKIMEKYLELVGESCSIEKPLKQEGRMIAVTLAPASKK